MAAPTASTKEKRMRLQRFLALSGLGSRRACEEFIIQGRVSVDGKTANKLGTTVDIESQKIVVDGRILKAQRSAYFAVYKPVDYICSNRVQGPNPRAIELIPGSDARLFCIGRLDVASEGLLLLTNDGDFSNMVTHPKFNIAKTYRVQVKGAPTADDLEKLSKGVWLAEGRTAPCRVKVTGRAHHSTTLLITVHEGRNRLVRRALARLELPVKKLIRVQIGPIRLGKLKTGQYRRLTQAEIVSLREIAATKSENSSKTSPRAGAVATSDSRSSKKSGAKKKFSSGRSEKTAPSSRTNTARPNSKKKTSRTGTRKVTSRKKSSAGRAPKAQATRSKPARSKAPGKKKTSQRRGPNRGGGRR